MMFPFTAHPWCTFSSCVCNCCLVYILFFISLSDIFHFSILIVCCYLLFHLSPPPPSFPPPPPPPPPPPLFRYSQTFDMNPKGISAWKGGAENCIWRKQGVWNVDPITKRPVLLRPDFFRRRPNGSEINFMNDYMVPFFQKFETAIRKEIPNAIIFAEPHINIALAWKEEVQPKMPNAERYAWAPHYYDLLTLLSKSFRKWIVVDPLVRFIFICIFF